MTIKEIFESYDANILKTYTREPIVFVKGKGSVLTDMQGKKYLDFFPGWGVSNLGHCHPKVMGAIREQVGKLIHIPNNFYNPHQAKLAKELNRIAFKSKVFFCNSGAEANEAAIKLVRAWGQGTKFDIITTLKSFHGRTMGALSATGQEKLHKGFSPLTAGFQYVPFNDIEAIKKTITPSTAAIMLELIQGEGGIHIADESYVKEIRRLCDAHQILMIVDEVQTGMGRTGQMFCYQHYGVLPDVMTLAKALGGGLPIGAMLVKNELADAFKPGMHGSTFAGSPLVTKAALGVIKAISEDKIIPHVKKVGAYLVEQLQGLQKKYSFIKTVRAKGLMVGIELNIEGADIFKECLQKGLIINCTQGNVLRIMPALNVTKRQIDKAIFIIDKAMETVGKK